MDRAFVQYAPYLQDPLVLIGFFLFLAFSFARALLKQGIIPTLPPGRGFQILRTILLYGFIIGLVLVLLGFGLKYQALRQEENRQKADRDLQRQELESRDREAEKSRQERAERSRQALEEQQKVEKNTVELLRGELQSNMMTANELRQNAITMLNAFQSLVAATRTNGIKILVILFPRENVTPGIKESPVALADGAMDRLAREGLDKDDLEGRKFAAMAQLVVATIGRTISTVQSLADADGRRYPVRSQIWDANQALLREISTVDVPALQRSYSAAHRLRTNYDVVVGRVVEYMESLREFLAPSEGVVNRQRLARVLVAERLALDIITAYATQLVTNIAELKTLQERLAKSAPSAH